MAETQKNSLAPLLRRLDEMKERLNSLEESLNDAAVLTNPQRMISATREAGQLRPVVDTYRQYIQALDAIAGLQTLIDNEADAEMSDLATAELPEAQAKSNALLEALKDEL